ncbi:MAG: hypothetical protein R3F54_14095 [Alphaproteobacteria bacterium]
MKLMKIFNRDDWKRSKKVKALNKVLDKLRKKKHVLEDALEDEGSEKKAQKLKVKLKANRQHRHKAEKLIHELD